MEQDPRIWIAALRGSCERLAALVATLTPEQLRAQSYCTDWTNAQVLSHLGSGAEIAMLMLPGALGQAEPVGREAFEPVWDSWNAKSPDDQAADALAADEKHVRALEQLTDAELAGVSLAFFGMTLDAAGMVRLRLGEHALHTWDIEVFSDPSATVAADAAGLLIDNVPEFLAPRLGKPQDEPFAARIRTTGPDRDYLLTAAETVTMADWPADGAAPGEVSDVTMPAEALLRLSYGRMDPGHTPPQVQADPAAVGRLREIFPGF
ncbi:MAG TPA: maleylpyruvate isomerase family mycothiol-dependent enzyme [Streptosporangiaceae bacterium]